MSNIWYSQISCILLVCYWKSRLWCTLSISSLTCVRFVIIVISIALDYTPIYFSFQVILLYDRHHWGSPQLNLISACTFPQYLVNTSTPLLKLLWRIQYASACWEVPFVTLECQSCLEPINPSLSVRVGNSSSSKFQHNESPTNFRLVPFLRFCPLLLISSLANSLQFTPTIFFFYNEDQKNHNCPH